MESALERWTSRSVVNWFGITVKSVAIRNVRILLYRLLAFIGPSLLRRPESEYLVRRLDGIIPEGGEEHAAAKTLSSIDSSKAASSNAITWTG